MMRLPTIALGALALSAISFTALADRVRVVFTDAKLDDKAALNYMLRQNDYKKFFVVFTGLKDMERANGDLHDFLTKLDFVPGEKVKFIGGNHHNEEEPHEVNFLGKPISLDDGFEDIINPDLFEEKDELFVTQIAQTPKEHILKLLNLFGSRFKWYHLLHGHNSKQFENGAKSEAATLRWLQELESTISQKSPNAFVVVTSNVASFVSTANGSTQLLKSIDGKVPVEHLQAALNDPFHAKQLLGMDKFMKDRGVKLNVHLNPSGEEITREELVKLVLLARKNETPSDKGLRAHFWEYVKEVIRKVFDQELLETMDIDTRNCFDRVLTHVEPGFAPKTELTVELCDANHVISVSREGLKFEPFMFVNGKEGITMAPSKDGVSHGSTLRGLDSAAVLGDLLKSFGGRIYPRTLKAETKEYSVARE